MAHQNWPFLLLQYICVMAFLYGGTHVLMRLLGARANAALSMAATPEVRARFQPYMEGLRGLLSLNIFYVHAAGFYTGAGYISEPFQEQLGILAVCYFFFMTGYLIWKGMIERGGVFSASRFLKGRLYRTFPAYALLITLVYITAFSRTGWKLAVPAWKLFVSYGMWLAFALPGGPAINGVHDTSSLGAGVLWTLTFDWVFYLVVPWLLWFGLKRWRVAWLGVVFIAISLVLRHYQYGSGIAARGYFVSLCFSGGFFTGMLIAEVKHVWPTWDWARSRAASAVAVFLYFAIPCFLAPLDRTLEVFLVLPAFILLVYGCDFFGFFNTRASILLGRISYSTYLFHAWVIIVATAAVRSVFHVDMLQQSRLMYAGWICVTGLATIALAFASHSLVEMPFTTLGKRRAARQQVELPAHPTRAEVRAALQEEAAQLPGMAEAEALLPQHRPDILK